MFNSISKLTSGINNMNLDNDKQECEENDDAQELECHARMIAFFAHKGGVSKTTNVHHLGYMLAQQFGMRVLLVDADPQTNLTQTLCRSARNDKWREEIDRGNIYTAIERLHFGLKDGEYIDPANCIEIKKNEIKKGNSGGELWLLPGSLDLARLEAQITFAHNITNPVSYPLFDDIAGGFRHLFISTCAHYNIDFCLIDMGPSIGELNKSLFWSSDYFIIPCSPDSYCRTTVKTMQKTLPLWFTQQNTIAEITKDQTMPLNPDPPQFLGTIMSLFQVSGKNKKIVKDSQHWMDIIKQTVTNELIPELKKYGMVQQFAGENGFVLAEIPHFLSLMPIAQRSFAPVFDIPQNGYCNQNEDGDYVEFSKTEIIRHKERAKYFENKYYTLAENIITMLNNESAAEEAEYQNILR